MKNLGAALWKLAVLAALLPGASRADALDDLQRGGDLFLQHAVVARDGEFTAAGRFLPKTPGSLNLTLSARAFGVNSDTVVNLIGTRQPGGLLRWSFTSDVVPDMHVGWNNHVQWVEGELWARPVFVAPDADGLCGGVRCPYNVRLEGIPALSWIRAHGSGTFGGALNEAVAVRGFSILGGLPRPQLAGFTVTTPRLSLCASSTPRVLTGEVHVDTPAPSGGAWVTITTSNRNIDARGVRVSEGATSARYTFNIAAGFSGVAMLTAASGGTTVSQPVSINKPVECAVFIHWLYLRDLLLSPKSLRLAALNGEGAVVGTYEEEAYLFRPKEEPLPLASLLGSGPTTMVDLNEYGMLVGSQVLDEQRYGLLLDTRAPEPKPVYVKEFEPRALNERNVVVGSRRVDGVRQAAAFNGAEVVDLKLEALTSEAVAVNNRNQVALTLDQGKGPRAYRYHEGELVPLAGEAEAEPRDLNEQGQVVGRVLVDGLWAGFVSTGDGKETQVLRLEGWSQAHANAINESGWVVGAAYMKEGESKSRGFLYTPDKGVVDLQELVDPESGVEVLEALAIGDDGTVLVRGLQDGAEGQFVLTP